MAEILTRFALAFIFCAPSCTCIYQILRFVPVKVSRELVFVVGLICQPIHFSITSNLIHKPQANTDPFIIGIRTQNIISDKSFDVGSDAGRKHFAELQLQR